MKAQLDPHLIAKTEGQPNPSQVYTAGKIRITVIAPELIRVEFDDRGVFLDKATQAVWYRDCGECQYTVKKRGIHLVAETDQAAFWINPRKKTVDFVEINGYRFPADNGDNLKGTHRTLDRAKGAVPLGLGVIGRNGVALMEDDTLILDVDGQCKPRPREKDLYCFATKDHQRALELYYRITGAPPMIPRYALGNWWSRYYAYTQQGYLDLMDTFREKDIPFTVATIDMDWHWVDVKEKFGCKRELDMYPSIMVGWTGYSWNTDLFPDYKTMLKQLKERNLHITVNLHPATGVRSYEDQYEEMCRAMGREPDGKTIRFDGTDPNFLNAYFRVLHKPYEQDGVDFWWIDWQQGSWSKMPGLDPLWVCNHYHTLDLAKNGKRPLILSRYGGIGSHRYPLGFSGDACINWSALDFQPYFTYNAANVGYTHWSHDIGGHYLGTPKDHQLYLRWLQFGVFTPILRLHSSNHTLSKEPWNHPAVEKEAVEALRFRHSLIPYIYTAFYENHKNAVPVCKPLYYDYPNVNDAYHVKNQYMFGNDLLVCPITTPWDKKGISTREIWLPEGVWTDIFTGEVLRGGYHTVSRDKKSIPVFAKQGAIIPLQNVQGNFCGNPEHLILDVFNNGTGAYRLYDDDGDSTDYISGKGAFTGFLLKGDVLTISPVEGERAYVPEKRTYTLCFRCGINGAQVFVNGTKCPARITKNTVEVADVAPTDKVEIILTSARK
jgi:alpha-glucosidase (family GH31 glycosyl hydrolase)